MTLDIDLSDRVAKRPVDQLHATQFAGALLLGSVERAAIEFEIGGIKSGRQPGCAARDEVEAHPGLQKVDIGFSQQGTGIGDGAGLGDDDLAFGRQSA